MRPALLRSLIPLASEDQFGYVKTVAGSDTSTTIDLPNGTMLVIDDDNPLSGYWTFYGTEDWHTEQQHAEAINEDTIFLDLRDKLNF